MRVSVIQSPFLEANCYVLASEGRAVIVDPGGATAEAVTRLVAEFGLELAGVLLTHGHADHLWDAAAVADPPGLPVYLPAEDEFFLADPLGALGLSGAFGLGAWRRPDRVERFAASPDGTGRITIGPFEFATLHTPGHSPGSTVFEVKAPDAGPVPVLLTGDVVFAGSVGRTDLPGGSPDLMPASLRRVAQHFAPEAVILPGHGPASDLATETATNPYLRAALS